MIGRAKTVANIALLAAVLAGAAVVIPRLESGRSLDLLKERGATFDVAEDGSVLWMTLPPNRTTDETLGLLRNNSRLIHLTLEDCSITDAGLRNLGTLESLKQLDLTRTRGPNEGLHQFGGCTAVENLRLGDCRWVDDDEIADITRFPNLITLDLQNTAVSDACVDDLLQLKHLSYLNLSRCRNMTDTGVRRLLELPELAQLNVQGASISIACWKELSQIQSDRVIYCPAEDLPVFDALHDAGGRLTSAISSPPVMSFEIAGPVDPDLLAPLGELWPLQTVLIRDAPLDDDDLQWLSGLTALGRVDLSGTDVSDRTVAVLSQSPLAVADLSGTRITDRGLADLARIDTLEMLRLNQTDIEGHGFAGFSDMQNLEYVRLSGSLLNDDGAANLARLPALRALTLADTNITDAGLASLGAAPALSSLDVDGTAIRGDGLAGLSRAKTIHDLSLECDQLEEESLGRLESFESLGGLSLGASVGDRGVQHLTRVTGLKSLSLSGTRLTPGVIPHLNGIPELQTLTIRDKVPNEVLAGLADVSGLRLLSLGNCEYDENSVQALQAARPDLLIVR